MAAAAFLLLAAASAFAAQSGAATAPVVVTMQVPSATQLSTTNCATGQADRTALGTVLPGSDAVGATGCAITFGSSNDTSRLRMYQQDGTGAAMFLLPRGPLDASFGASGTWTTDLVAGQDDWYVDVERLADGSYLLLGRTMNANADAFVEKRDASWTLDGSFGVGGRRAIDVFNPDEVLELDVDHEGRPVVLVRQGSNAGVARLTTTGDMDPDFGGGDGEATFPSTSTRGMELLPDGRTLVAGLVIAGTHNVRLTMVDETGALDTGWSTGGRFDLDITGGHEGAVDAVVRGDGTIVVLVAAPADGGNVTLLGLDADGFLDPSFGTAGMAQNIANTTLACCAWVPDELQETADGQLLVSGHISSGAVDHAWLLRTSSTGVRDATFGTDGAVMTNGAGSDDNGTARMLQLPDGSYMLTATPTIAGTRTMKAWRIGASGQIDTRFGSNGRVSEQVGGAEALAHGLLLDADGRVLVVGRALSGTEWNLAAARLDSTRLTQYDHATGKNFLAAGESVFGACLVSTTSAVPTAPWAAAGTGGCTAAGNANWRAVAATGAAAGGEVASAASGVTSAQVLLRFGMHAHGALPPGTYTAPIALEVVAP